MEHSLQRELIGQNSEQPSEDPLGCFCFPFGQSCYDSAIGGTCTPPSNRISFIDMENHSWSWMECESQWRLPRRITMFLEPVYDWNQTF